MHRRIRKGLRAEKGGQRRGEDQEREQRHQRGDGQVTGHGPSVVIVEMSERVVENTFDGCDPA
jgi:hypothetical protein